MNKKIDEEISKLVLEWFMNKNYTKSAEEFMKEANMKKEDSTKGNQIEKKWGSILVLQKQATDLENQIKQLKQTLENGITNSNANNNSQKDPDSVGVPQSIAKSTIKGHKQSVTCIVFHPVYKRLASGSDDASIIIWECNDYTQEKCIRAHSNSINSLSFDHNGKYLASCSSDMLIKIWNFDTMTCIKTLKGHEHTVSSIDFSPDSILIFSSSRDKTVKVWEVSSGNCKKTLEGHSDWVRTVSVNNKGTLLASAAEDQNIIIWQIDTYAKSKVFSYDNKIDKVLFLKNDKSLLNVFTSDYVTGKDKEEEEKKSELEKINEKLLEKTKIIKAKEEIGNKQYLLSAGRDNLICLWDVDIESKIYIFKGHENWVRDICEHSSGRFIISVSDDKSLRVWDLKTGKIVKGIIDAHDKFVGCVAMSGKFKLIASGSNDMKIKVWDCS